MEDIEQELADAIEYIGDYDAAIDDPDAYGYADDEFDVDETADAPTPADTEVVVDGGANDVDTTALTAAMTRGVTDADLSDDDTIMLMLHEFRRKQTGGHSVESINSLFLQGFPQIIKHVFRIAGTVLNKRDLEPSDKEIREILYHVQPTDVIIEKPVMYTRNGVVQPLVPNAAHVQTRSYEASIYMDVEITLTAMLHSGGSVVRRETLKHVLLTSFPCGIGSVACHTYGLTREALKQIHEDPDMPPGYFILRGGLWNIESSENLANNTLHIHKNRGHMNEVARALFISKPGDAFENSFQTIIRLLNTGAITIELTLGKDDKIVMPFYVLFRALGMTSDRDIVDHIVYGVDNSDVTTVRMLGLLDDAFKARDPKFAEIENEMDSRKILLFIGELYKRVEDPVAAKKNRNVQKYRLGWFLSVVDKILMPHIGVTESLRIRKLKFLGHLIRELIQVHLDILPTTDRDGYQNKRIHAAGKALAKMFKTRFNLTVVQAITHAFNTKIPTTSFEQVRMEQILRDSINDDKLRKALVKLMSPSKKDAGGGPQNREKTASRINPNQLYVKNQLTAIAAMNDVVAPDPPKGKSNDRAIEMRQTHATHHGFVCVSASADSGELVGMKKQLAVSATISESSSSDVLKAILRADADIIADVPPRDITRLRLAIVLVNGYPLGYVRESHAFVARYRMLRRLGRIHRRVSIVWEVRVNKVSFWTDYGRLHRPLIIVYNNEPAYVTAKRAGKPIEFAQWIALTRDDIRELARGTTTLEHLEERGIIEYISAEEQLNAYVARSVEFFREHAHDVLHPFTHVEDPRAIFGITALAAVLPHNSNAVRITMQTNHRKQACGWPATNHPYLQIKNTTVAHYVDTPLITAFTDAVTTPTGQNVMVALVCHHGHNTEDSIDVNATSCDRGMFSVLQYTVHKAECEHDSKFEAPNVATTSSINREADFRHVNGAAARVGSVVTRNDVIIAKITKTARGGEKPWSDQSILHKRQEDMRVVDVIETRDGADKSIVKVKLGANRPLRDGDKLASRTGNKGIVAKLRPCSDMPYTADGVVADLLVNVHSIPTRMALNQIGESALGLKAAADGGHIDATAFRQIDMIGLIDELRKLGYENAGHQRMYNGLTGEPMDALVFMGPTHYMRLQKFVVDEQFANARGPTSALTHQPLQGKNQDGGMRLGEMEKDVMVAQGAIMTLNAKYHADSDGVTAYLCKTCGGLAVANPAIGLYRCNTCQGAAAFVRVETTRTALLVHHRIAGLGIKMSYGVDVAGFAQ